MTFLKQKFLLCASVFSPSEWRPYFTLTQLKLVKLCLYALNFSSMERKGKIYRRKTKLFPTLTPLIWYKYQFHVLLLLQKLLLIDSLKVHDNKWLITVDLAQHLRNMSDTWEFAVLPFFMWLAVIILTDLFLLFHFQIYTLYIQKLRFQTQNNVCDVFFFILPTVRDLAPLVHTLGQHVHG
jgi:hypothetical protein